MRPFYTSNDYKRHGGKSSYYNADEKNYRSHFWRDRARLMHSPAFRRLKGKTQLFPNKHNDFFRCRLTHSLEVANVGKTIAQKLNWQLREIYKQNNFVPDSEVFFIDCDLVEFACLAHDIGHPPFGHQGEYILNKKMIHSGGFEGNAQTFRILSIIEKKELEHVEGYKEDYNYVYVHRGEDYSINDRRLGLNLTFRSLASVIKYNKFVEHNYGTAPKEDKFKVEKGIYISDKERFEAIKDELQIDGDKITIEAQIMDFADDVAYSTYDLEDSFKGGFLHPLKLFRLEPDFQRKVVEEVNKTLKKHKITDECKEEDVRNTIEKLVDLGTMDSILQGEKVNFEFNKADEQIKQIIAPNLLKLSLDFSQNAYSRNKFSSSTISRFVSSCRIELNYDKPLLSELIVPDEIRKEIEILKKITYLSQISSTKLKIVEHRGQHIIDQLFDILVDRDKNINGQFLIPDVRKPYLKVLEEIGYLEQQLEYIKKVDNEHVEIVRDLDELEDSQLVNLIETVEKSIETIESYRKRLICDFIASMTNRYAVDYLDRLTSLHSSRSFLSFSDY